MKAKDYRNEAKQKISDKWNYLALINFVESLILGAASFVVVGDLIVGGAITLGFAGISLAVVRHKEFSITNLFDGFNNFLSSLILFIINAVLIFLWSLLLIVPGIIKSYSYSMSFYILHDNPNMDPNDARKLSTQLMNGHKWELFCLHFSFIGWYLLSIITFGILSFWVIPYVRIAEAEFYERLKNENLVEYTTKIAEE